MIIEIIIIGYYEKFTSMLLYLSYLYYLYKIDMPNHNLIVDKISVINLTKS